MQLAKASALQGCKASEAQPGYRADRTLARATFDEHLHARARAAEASIRATIAEGLRSEHMPRTRLCSAPHE